jgi:hypothetical protein
MKIKDVLSEIDVQVKPITGAQEVDVNGQKVGAATDPVAAQQLAQMYKDGKVTATPGQDPNKPQGAMEEGMFGTTEEELAKLPPGDPAGDYYKKLAALKTDPRWAGKQDLVMARIKDLIDRIDSDKGVPQPGQGQAMGPETDPTKFQQKNPGFGEPSMLQKGIDKIKGAFQEQHKDTVAQGGGDVGGDGADEFIRAVQIHPHVKGSYQAEQRSADDKLLDQMLTIAKLR